MGCLPKIGDPCSTSLDCSQQGERLCDPTQPDGYCTVFNCEPDSCPDNAACVSFNEQVDPACGTANDGEWPRFERTFCMAPCGSETDCRDGYACVAATDDAAGRKAVDQLVPRDKVCIVKATASDDGGGQTSIPGVCQAGEPGTPDPYEPPLGATGSGGSTAGTGGSGGSGGSSASTGGAGTGGAGTGGTGTGGSTAGTGGTGGG